MAEFEKLRVSLTRDAQGPILREIGYDDSHRSRQEFLIAAFAEEHSFLHVKTGKRFDFIPIKIDGDYVAGIFRRAAPVPLHNVSLEQYEAENYEGAVFIMSVAKDQTAWMQFNRKLGSPKPILESFFNFLAKKTDVNDWKIFVKHFEDEQEYFSVISEKRNEIAEISFTFIPPNALSADDEVYNFVKTLQLEAHPDTQKHTYKADPGQMIPDTEYMNASARVAMAGGGDAEVRDKKRRLLYGKANGKVTQDVPNDDLPTPNHVSFISRVRTWLYGDEG
ncbi:MAG: hypothetical protein Pars93KO_27860 [Parasphingorhabdus sp.]